jgi:hypothetical protein
VDKSSEIGTQSKSTIKISCIHSEAIQAHYLGEEAGNQEFCTVTKSQW